MRGVVLWVGVLGVGCGGKAPTPTAAEATSVDEAKAPEPTPAPAEDATAQQTPPAEEGPPEEDLPAGEHVEGPVLGHRGHLRRTPDGSTFTACGGSAAWSLADPQGLLAGTAPPTGQPTYAEVHLKGGDPDHTVVAVLYADPAGETKGCDAPVRVGWRAAGNEPFWTLAQNAQGTLWSTPEGAVQLGPLTREEEALVAMEMQPGGKVR